MWDCLAEAKVYNPQLKKFNFKTISCYFIAYPKWSECFTFHCPSNITRIVETRHVIFENGNVSRSNVNRTINLEENRTYVSISIIWEVTNSIPLVREANEGTHVHDVSNINEAHMLATRTLTKVAKRQKICHT